MEARSISSLQFMERDGMHMKDDGVGRNSTEPKFEIPWAYCERPCIGGGGFAWPPRSYTCSFCKRQFRSAQALGGHMNVHRRDRARLRQSPPWAAQDSNTPNTNPNPKQSENPNNPKPSCASSSPSSRPYAITRAFPNLVSSPSSLACISPSPPSTSSASDARIAEMVLPPSAPLLGTLLFQGHASRTREEAVEPVKLDLEIGLCGNPATGDLDLELRLGYS